MANLKKMVEKSTSTYPYTAVIRNYLASSPLYAAKYTEWQRQPGLYDCTLNLYKRGDDGKATGWLFRVSEEGSKNETLERLFKKIYEYLTQWNTQGLDEDLAIETVNERQVDDRKENVIITGNEDVETGGNDPIQDPTMSWVNTEKYYDFTKGDSALMARWFPLDSIMIDTKYGPDINGGFVKSWIIPEELIKNDFDSINILPIRGFLKGEFELEFKMVAQANSFQQCLLMLSLSPYSYGISPTFNCLSGLKIKNSATTTYLRPWSAFSNSVVSYNDFQCAVQRPNVLLDISSGGEVMLKLSQKYHKTLIRNFDYAFVSSVNPGIRGSNLGAISIHVLSALRYGTGSTSFNVRLFYRFVKTQLTAMVPVVNMSRGTFGPIPVKVRADKFSSAVSDLKAVTSEKDTEKRAAAMKIYRAKYLTQGAIMSVVSGVKAVMDTTSDVIGVVERSGTRRNKGIGASNRDKPIDVVSQIRVVPRPRTNFSSGVGIDDAIVMGVGWDELTEFFSKFTDEPKNFYEYSRIVGFMSSFEWDTAAYAGDGLFEWNIHPTLMPGAIGSMDLKKNVIRNPMMIASSAFTNYWGTIELMFQFIKTSSHRGAVEVAIYFGGDTSGSGLKSTYVKILNLQENPIFKVTIPYIYDTTVRTIAGTATPIYIPNIGQSNEYSFFHTAKLKVRVLNELTAVSVVSQSISCLVWVRGGNDFGLNYPHAMNTTAVANNFQEEFAFNPSNVKETYISNATAKQYFWNARDGTVVESPSSKYIFLTEGLDEADFAQGEQCDNRITNVNHMDFKNLLKMPVKLFNSFPYSAIKSMEFTDLRNTKAGTFNLRSYFCMPVCPLNTSLVNFLNQQYFGDKAEGVSVTGATVGNYESWKSIQCQIMTMFMMYRGTITYTIIIKDGTGPVYYSYIPHDYHLRKLNDTLPINNMISYVPGGDGENRGKMGPGIQGMLNDTQIDLAMTGLINGFIIPSINPTEKIAIPMSTQCNYLLLNRQQASAVQPKATDHNLKTMRENSEWFNGTLALWSDADFKFDLYVNCGDDLELGGFMGHPGVQNLYSQFATSDNWRVQGLDSGFRIKELTQYGWNSFKKAATNLSLGVGLSVVTVNINPTVASITGALAVYSAIGGITQLKELCSEVPKIVAAETTTIVNELTAVGTDTLLNIISEFFPFLKNSFHYVGSTIWAISQHLIHAIVAQNWKNTAFAAFGVLVELKLLGLKDWNLLKDCMENCVKLIMPQAFSCQGPANNTENMDGAWMPLMEILISIIGIKFQMKSIGGLRSYLRDIFKYQNYKNISGMNAVLVFARTLFRAVSIIVKTCFTTKDPNIALLEKIQSKDKLMGTFIEEANRFLNIFSEKDFKKKDKRVEFLHTILRAYKLRMLLIKIGNPRLTSQLLTLCDKVIDKASKSRYLLRCDVITQEPFIICVEGASKIGKSFSVYDMVGELLQSTGIKYNTTDLIFTIPAGADYWNGYMDQPVLWYDDWCNITDEQTMRQHISQLYALKTSAPFNVPRAELENKEQIATPQLIIMTTNAPFPVSNVILCPQAVYRRRDVLVKFGLKGDKSISQFTQEELKNFEHLEIQFYGEVENPSSLQTTKLNYSEFLTEVKARFSKFRIQEAHNQKVKYNSLLKAVETSPIDDLDFENPFISIEKFVYEQAEGVTEKILDKNIEELLFLIKERATLENSVPSDESLFQSQGFIGEIGKFCVSGKDKIQQTFSSWMEAYSRQSMRCAICSCFAPVHGTVFWCSNHSHYLCLHCTTCAGIKEFENLHDFDMHLTTWRPACMQCVEDGAKNEVIIVNKGFYHSMAAKILSDAIETPYQVVTALKTLFQKQGAPLSLRTMYACVMMFKVFIFTYSAIFKGQLHAIISSKVSDGYKRNVFATEGLEVDSIVIPMNVITQLIEYRGMTVYIDKLVDTTEDQFVCLDGCGASNCQLSILFSTVKDFLSRNTQQEMDGDSEVVNLGNACRVYSRIQIHQDKKIFSDVSTQWYSQEESVPACDQLALYKQLKVCQSKPEQIPNYLCQHSLLAYGFSYSQGKFYLITDLVDGLQIPDRICANPIKCCLLNRRFLEMLKDAFVFDYITVKNIMNSMNVEQLEYWVPKFLHQDWKIGVKKQRDSLISILRKDWWDVYVSPLGDWFMSLVRTIAPIVIAGGVLWGTWYMASKAWDALARLFGLGEVQGLINSGSSPSRRAKTRSKARSPYQTHSLPQDENFENKLDKIAANYAVIECGKTFISVWGLTGTMFIVPKHLGKKIKAQPSIVLKRVVGALPAVTILTSNMEFSEDPMNDLMLINCQRTPPLFKNCSHFLRKRDQEKDFGEGVFVSCNPVSQELEDISVKIFSTISNFEASEASTGEIFRSSEAVTYDYQKKGLCGSVICVHSVTPIYAMHVAGSDSLDRGVGVLIYSDSFGQSFDAQGVSVCEEVKDTGDDTYSYGEDVKIEYLASVSKDQIPFIPKDTNIIPSVISECFPHPAKTRPAILHSKDPSYKWERSPLFYGVCKNGKPTLDFPIGFMNMAFDVLKDRLLMGKQIRQPKVLSIKEAVVGLPDIVVDDKYNDEDDLYYDSLPLDTSAGFPFTTTLIRNQYKINSTSKEPWLNVKRNDQQRVVDCDPHPYLLQMIKDNSQQRQTGKLAFNVFQDCLKDERRKIDKALSMGGTRLFSMSNLEGTISLRRYTLDLTSHLRYNRIKNGMAVGINCDSMEWTILANSLLAISNNIFTTDFTNFGAGLNVGVASYFIDLIKEFYYKNFGRLDDYNMREIECLIWELLNSKHVVGNLIYGTIAGSPSGAAITVEINSFTHLMYIYIVFKIIGEINYGKLFIGDLEYKDLRNYIKKYQNKKLEFSYEAFLTNVYACTYGDDGIFSVSDDYKELFNAVTINLVLKEHGIGVTDASKSEQIKKYGSLGEATFLKRNFLKVAEMPSFLYLAAIDWTSVEECVRWVHKKPYANAYATRENCVASLHLAFGHGKQKYDNWRQLLNTYLEKKSLEKIYIEWEDIGKKFFPEINIESY